MFKPQYEFENPSLYPSLTLAMIGDSIYDLYVRTRLIKDESVQAHNLHKRAVKFVNASAQAKSIHAIEDRLTEEEIAVFKRGRNAKSVSVPKNADVSDYRAATGFEALLGWLYLKGAGERLDEVLEISFESVI